MKLELEPCSATDRGSYKLTVKNEKGEVTSNVIEVTELPDEEPAKKKQKQVKWIPAILRRYRTILRSSRNSSRVIFQPLQEEKKENKKEKKEEKVEISEKVSSSFKFFVFRMRVCTHSVRRILLRPFLAVVVRWQTDAAARHFKVVGEYAWCLRKILFVLSQGRLWPRYAIWPLEKESAKGQIFGLRVSLKA